MRIESQFKDYYDHVQKFSTSFNHVYHRNISAIKVDRTQPYWDGRRIEIGFCGKIYHCLGSPVYHEHKWNEPSVFKHYHTYLTAEEYFARHDVHHSKSARETRRQAEADFRIEESNDLFIQHNTPVFIVLSGGYEDYYLCPHSLTRNKQVSQKQYGLQIGESALISHVFDQFVPTLKLMNFDRIMPANQAYMNIESYINGVLGIEYKAIPIMDNETKIDQAGFDKKTSFRG